MILMDGFILGSACFWIAIFLTKIRDAWYLAYYNDDGTPNGY